MDSIWSLLFIIGLISLPLLWGMIRSRFRTNQFYGDEMNKKKNQRTLEDEAYEKSSTASQGQNNNLGGP